MVLICRNDVNRNAVSGCFVGVVRWIATPMVENRNTILWNYVDTGTINRPLRLRNGRGKIYQQTPTCGLFIIQNVWQRTHRNIHFLRKYMAVCTPQGVGADSSRPFFNPNQMVLIYRNDAKRNAVSGCFVGVVRWIAIPMVENRNTILWNYVDTGTINRPLRLRNGRGEMRVTINKITELQHQWWKIATLFCDYSGTQPP